MTELPADELQALPYFLQEDNVAATPFRVIEFGNKKNRTGTYRDWYISKGCVDYTSIDWNGQDGALPLDVNEPIFEDLGPADIVTNFGFSEHVTDQRSFWENNHHLCKIGGAMSGVTPAPGHWPHHGILQPTLEFYQALAELNNYRARCWTNTDRRRHTNCYHFVQRNEDGFVWDDALLDLITPTEAPTPQALRNSGL